MKNPYDCDDLEELRDICLYWMQKANNLREYNEVYVSMLLENKINPSLQEIFDRMKKRD